MFIEIVDALRCPIAHEESWLVLAPARLEARHIQEGTLGCHVCRASYPIHEGIADLRASAGTAESDAARGRGSPESGERERSADAAMRLAAMLNLGDASGLAVLSGSWGVLAPVLLEVVDCPPLLLVEPPPSLVMRSGISGLRCDDALPLAAGAARAVVLDEEDGRLAESAAQATRVGGRVVAPATIPVPLGLREIARDGTIWVAEREAAASAPIALRLGRR